MIAEPKRNWWKRWDLWLVAGIVLLVLGSALAYGRYAPEVNPKETILFEGHPYSKFQEFAGTPGGVRGTPLSYDSLWGPMTRNTEFEMNGQTYTADNCVGEGHRDTLPWISASGPYSSLVCYATG